MLFKSSHSHYLALIALGLGAGAFSAHAATYTAASPSYADVSTAISKAADGDTVAVPAGSATWTSTLALRKAITLKGAGATSTKISANGLTMMTVALSADKPVRVTGMAFTNASGTKVPTLIVYGRDHNGSGTPVTSLRIDHCAFTFGKRAVNPDGYVYGVVDHNTFVNCDIAVGINGDNNFAWQRAIEPGSINTLCIEDNTFTINNSTPLTPNEQIYHQEGTRTTIRYNTFDSRSYTNGDSLFFDCHGNQGYYSGNNSKDFRGTVLVEFYNNTMQAYKTYRMMYIRAGTIFAFNNTMTTQTGTPVAFALSEEEAWQTQFFNPLKTSWPAQDQVTNSHFWNNTLKGAAITSVGLWNAKDSTFIQNGRDYWMSAPASGQKYYPYKPLVYPHPLVTAQDSGSDGGSGGGTSTAPAAVTGFKVVTP